MSARIYRVSIADEEFARLGWRREHFASRAEADAVEALASEQGFEVVRHEISFPDSASALADLLNMEAGRTGKPA